MVQGNRELAAWAGLELIRPLDGGHRNDVMLAGRGDERLVVRRSTRPAASLDWELDLLDRLRAHGLGVPEPVPADDGRRQVDGVLVNRFVAGRRPETGADWQRVVETLAALHKLTAGWPQRPGSASSLQLLARDRGADVRLDLMPAESVTAIRAAWRAIQTPPVVECVVHGDIGAGNILLDGDRVTLLDWDESRVDIPWFDFAFVPEDVPLPRSGDRYALETAGVAWEAATCWTAEPEYARRRLAEFHTRTADGRPAERRS